TEAAVEGAIQHVVLRLFQPLGTCQSATEHFECGRGVHAVGLQKEHGFGQRLDVAHDDQLVCGFHGLPGTTRAHVDQGFADRVQYRFRGGEVRVGTTGHDGQRGVLRTRLATGNRCVDEPHTALVRLLTEFDRHIGADTREIDDQCAGLCGVEHAPLSGEYLLHVGRIRDHDRDDV